MKTLISSTGVNHLAISTRDIKSQIAYFTDVLGCPAHALYRMHEGAEVLEHDYASHLSADRTCALGIQPNTGKPFRSVTLDLEHAARPEPLTSATVTSIHRRRRQR